MHSSPSILLGVSETPSLEMSVLINRGHLLLLWRRKGSLRAMWLGGIVVNLVLRTKVLRIWDRMLSSLKPQARANPNQNPLRVVIMVRVRRSFGERRVVNLLKPQGRKEITRTEDKNLSRIILVKVFSRTLVGVVQLILVLLRVFTK